MPKKTSNESFTDYARSIGDGMWKAGRSTYLAGLGIIAVAEQESGETFDRLVTKGERIEKDDRNVVNLTTDRVKQAGRKVEDTVQQVVTATLKRAGVPSREEICKLTQRVETLTRKVEQLGATR